MSSEGYPAVPNQSGATAHYRLQWPFATNFLNLNLLGRVWQSAANNNECLAHLKFKKNMQTAITICSRLQYPTRTLRRAGGP
jgi:hypothetical protein